MRVMISLLLLLVVNAATADMFVVGVTEDGRGIAIPVTVEVREGNGNVLLNISTLVDTDTQQSIRDAIHAALRELNREQEFYNYDYSVTIESVTPTVGGPSAGLPLAILFYYALQGKDVPDTVSATGTITRDGRVGPVGKIFQKVLAAHKAGVKLFLIPRGERFVEGMDVKEIEPGLEINVAGTVDIVAYARKELNMEVYEVSTLTEAIRIIEGERPEVNIPVEEPVLEVEIEPVTLNFSMPFRSIVERIIGELPECEEEIPPALRELLLSYRNLAKGYMERARELLEKNYLYTAGNYAFLARVYNGVYLEVCRHPSIMDTNSLYYSKLYSDVYGKLSSLVSRANSYTLTTENMEWLGGARQRIIRARDYLERSKSSGGIEGVRMLMYAREWLESAEDMLEMVEGGGVPLNISEEAEKLIIEAEDLAVNESDVERIQWARRAYDMGWYYAAYAEAATVIGEITSRKVTRLESYDVNYYGLWGELYAVHGFYYFRLYELTGDPQYARTAKQMEIMAAYLSDIARKGSITVTVQEVKEEADGTLMILLAPLLLLLVLLALYVLSRGEGVKVPEKYRERYTKIKRDIRYLKKRINMLKSMKRGEKDKYIVQLLDEEIEKTERKLKRKEEQLKKLLKQIERESGSR